MCISADILIPLISSFVISVVFAPCIIWILKHLNVLQTVRKEGVKSHLKKNGTPTMGGLIIIFATVISSVSYIDKYPNVSILLFVMLAFGIIGFIDDYMKVAMKDTKGLTPIQKMTAQTVVAVILLFYLNKTSIDIFEFKVPFVPQGSIRLNKISADIIYMMAILGTVNGVNFTDGIDGLAGGVTLLVLCFFTAVSAGMKCGLEPAGAAAIGALSGFMVYNLYPAKLFMGDTGSLALGGLVAAFAVLMKMPLFLPVVGLIYLIEVLSVIIQVGYYKITNGKRFFKMAPIHHHLEMCGYKETQVVDLFAVITAVMCVIILLLC